MKYKKPDTMSFEDAAELAKEFDLWKRNSHWTFDDETDNYWHLATGIIKTFAELFDLFIQSKTPNHE